MIRPHFGLALPPSAALEQVLRRYRHAVRDAVTPRTTKTCPSNATSRPTSATHRNLRSASPRCRQAHCRPSVEASLPSR
jgi:hypothetical protein